MMVPASGGDMPETFHAPAPSSVQPQADPLKSPQGRKEEIVCIKAPLIP